MYATHANHDKPALMHVHVEEKAEQSSIDVTGGRGLVAKVVTLVEEGQERDCAVQQGMSMKQLVAVSKQVPQSNFISQRGDDLAL